MKKAVILAMLPLFLFIAVPAAHAAADSDGDGYDDVTELLNGYDPFGLGRPSGQDADGDGLTDVEERLFGSDPTAADSDGDSYADGEEVRNGYDPAAPTPARLKKRIEISLSHQELTYYLGPKPINRGPVSTGRPGKPTPVGRFAINRKIPRAWSGSAKLWMPWWMSFIGNTYGIHELPEWPGGRKEGAESLGTPASGGCVRLGVGPAKELYDWAEVGTPVIIE